MALETATYISGLNSANPTSSDTVAEGDNHIRLLKLVLKNTFPNLSAAVTADAAGLNKMDGVTATTAELNKLTGLTASTAEMNRLVGLTQNVNAIVPAGIIAMWSGASTAIPAGWLLCNGQNGTPDLRDRFVVGAGNTYAVGATGGADTVTLTEAQIPAHSHTYSGSTSASGDHTHIVYNTAGGNYTTEGSYSASIPTSGNWSFYKYNNLTTSAAGNHSHTFSGTTSSVGSGSAHENRPPYYALCYIMKV